MGSDAFSLLQSLSITPFGAVIALVSGFMAYYTSYAGLRRGHSRQDALFISIVFGLAALVAFQAMYEWHSILRIVGTLGVTIVLSIIWRKWLRTRWNHFMRRLGVHCDDGIPGAWDELTNADRVIGQVSVHTTDGRILYLDDRRKYRGTPWNGLYLGSDESIAMVVDREELPDGTIEERKDIYQEDWGVRLTYLPSSSIRRVNFRMQ